MYVCVHETGGVTCTRTRVYTCVYIYETNFLWTRVAKQLGHAAELFRSVLFGMDEASRVTAGSSHEIQSRIFGGEIEEFLKDDAAGPSRFHGLLTLSPVNMYEPVYRWCTEILDLGLARERSLSLYLSLSFSLSRSFQPTVRKRVWRAWQRRFLNRPVSRFDNSDEVYTPEYVYTPTGSKIRPSKSRERFRRSALIASQRYENDANNGKMGIP